MQRNQIQVLLQTKTPVKTIAHLVDTDKSTLYREIRRNKLKRPYFAPLAQQLCSERKERFGRGRKLTTAMEKVIVEMLNKEQWSPKQIVGHCRLNHTPMVSF